MSLHLDVIWTGQTRYIMWTLSIWVSASSFLTPQTEAQIDWSRMRSVQFVSQHDYARNLKVKVIKLGGEEKHGQRRKLFYLVNIGLTILTVK